MQVNLDEIESVCVCVCVCVSVSLYRHTYDLEWRKDYKLCPIKNYMKHIRHFV